VNEKLLVACISIKYLYAKATLLMVRNDWKNYKKIGGGEEDGDIKYISIQ